MSLLVSIHDVTPALEPWVRELWKLCKDCGVIPALLVVPDWHGEWPIERHGAFVQWILERANDGAEIFLHGERHDEVGLPRTFRDKVRAFGRTSREGEFLTFDEAQAAERIERGLQRLRAFGMVPIGFVPPAWLAKEDTFRAVARAGLALSEDESGIRIHARRSHVPAPAVRWSGRTALRALGSELVAQARWHLQRNDAYVRLALHPQDLQNARTAQSVRKEIVRWTRATDVVAYRTLLDAG